MTVKTWKPLFAASLLICSTSIMAHAKTTSADAKPADAQSIDSGDSLDSQLKKIDVAIKDGIKQAAQKYRSETNAILISKTLPSQDQVVQKKDTKSFQEYGGLSEMYLFGDKVKEAEKLRTWIDANASTVMGDGDPRAALLDSDFALYYYDQGNFDKAKPLFSGSMATLEDAFRQQPELVRNNLISIYAGLSEIAWKEGKKEEALKYLEKIGKVAPPPSGGNQSAAQSSPTPTGGK